MNGKEKEEIMTDVLMNMKEIMDTEEIKVECQTPKIDAIYNFLVFKSFAKKFNDEIKKCTERNKNIRNGQTVIAGTRITTKELLLIMSENISEKNIFEYVLEQYPSIDSEDKIFYSALYEIKRQNTIGYILKVLLSKK